MNNPFLSIDERLSNIEIMLLEMKHPLPTPQPEADGLLTVPQAAAFLNLAVPTIYTHISKGTIPHFKKSKKVYFSKAELLAWLKEDRKLSSAEIEAQTDAYLSTRKAKPANQSIHN